MAKLYKTRKVFDCQPAYGGMTQAVMAAFLRATPNKGNDCFVEWEVVSEGSDDYDEEYIFVSKWLLENGAKENERVLIKHWW